MGKFKVEIAKSGITNALPIKSKTDVVPVENIKNLQFRRKYYDLSTDEPLSLVDIESRLKKNFQRMDKISVEVMLDLYFIYCNWDSFYSRADSFKDYLKTTFPISKSYCYDIIKVVKMLIEYTEQNVSTNGLFLDEMCEPIQSVGLTKLKTVSCLKDKDDQFIILNKLLDGEEISVNDIKKSSFPEETIHTESVSPTVTINDMNILVDNKIILTFQDIKEDLQIKIFNLVQKFYGVKNG